MTREIRRLIVGTAGGANAFGTIRAVRDRCGESVFIIATDTNPREMVAASAIADAFVQVPLASSPEFPEALGHIAVSYPGSTYLPVHDAEIEIAARLAAEGTLPHGLVLIAPPYDMVRLCSDKWAMHQWLRAHGLPSPETALATPAALERMGAPVALKPREGYGSKFVRLIREPAELAEIDPTRWLLQEPLRENEVALDVFLSRDTRRFYCVCREYLALRAGVVTNARVFHDPVLADIAERLARGLPLFGVFMFQVMRNAASQWQIVDINPRVGRSTAMGAAAGLHFAAANLADFWGEPTDAFLQPLTGERYVARQYADYVTRKS
jgi:carbamoylphosphate synthase large subunit